MTVSSPSLAQTGSTEIRVVPRLAANAIDSSARLPVLALFSGAAAWLALGAIFGVISAIKAHAPGFLAGLACLTYGRVRPASLDMLVYGFALQASLGLALWIICRLGRNLLVAPWTLCAATLLWNAGVLIGTVQVLGGDATGYPWFEFPRTATPILFVAHLLLGGLALVNLHVRAERRMFVSQWFLFAALLWFAWIYSTAQLLLIFWPVRGVMQVVVDGWYIHNLSELCLGSYGLAVLFYLMPKVLGRNLQNHGLAMFGFWLLVVLGGWGGLRIGQPVPNWLSGVSGVGSILLIVPLLALAFSWFGTQRGASSKLSRDSVGLFLLVAGLSYFVGEALRILGTVPAVDRITLFSLYDEGVTQLRLHGFLAMALLGGIYYAAPRLTGLSWPAPGLVRIQFWCTFLGLILLVIPLLVGGVVQGTALDDPSVPFLQIMRRMLPFLGTSTLGATLLCLGYLIFVVHLGRLLAAACPCGSVKVSSLFRPVAPASAGGVKA